VQFSVGKPVECARFHAGSKIVAVGGQEHDLALYDVETAAPTFQARNVPHTMLDLRVPVWVSAIQFLPDIGTLQTEDAVSTSASRPDASPHVVALVSRHRHARIYDIRASRRPMVSTEIGEFALTAVETTNDGSGLLVGDSTGILRRLDLRAGLRQMSVYKGIGGSIKAIAVSSKQPYVFSAGLDRCLHVHQIESRERLRRVYLKQCLTAMLLVPTLSVAGRDAADTTLAPEPPPDSRVRITYVRGVAVPQASTAAVEDDDDALWADLDRRAAAGIKRPRIAASQGGSLAAGSDDDVMGRGAEEASSDYDDDEDNLEDADGDSDAPLPRSKAGTRDHSDDGGDASDEEEVGETDDEGDGDGLNSAADSEDDDDDDDDPLVSSQAAARSLRREVETVQRAETRQRAGGAGKVNSAGSKTGRR
jgi:hypothetical protein